MYTYSLWMARIVGLLSPRLQRWSPLVHSSAQILQLGNPVVARHRHVLLRLHPVQLRRNGGGRGAHAVDIACRETGGCG